jgi:hypothetical protein
MVKIQFILATAFLALILVFTFFGEKIYILSRPKVEVASTGGIIDMSEIQYVLLPLKSIVSEDGENYVYTLQTNSGFSMNITTVQKQAVGEILTDLNYEDFVLARTDETHFTRELVVVWRDFPIENDDQVIIAR